MAQLGENEVVDGTALSGINYRFMGVLGHMMVEVVDLTANPSAGDYFYTRLQSPIGLVARATSDAGGNTDSANVSLSGKTVTVDASPTGNNSIGIIIFGR